MDAAFFNAPQWIINLAGNPKIQKFSSTSSMLYNKRATALANLQARGIPNYRCDDWKYTNLVPVLSKDYCLADFVEGLEVSALLSDSLRLVFINGVYCESASNFTAVPEVKIAPMFEVFKGDGNLSEEFNFVEEFFNTTSCLDGLELLDLNTALFIDGAYLRVPKGVKLSVPIELIHLSETSQNEYSVSAPRSLLIFEEDSSAIVIERFIAVGGGEQLLLPATEYFLGAGSDVHNLRISDEITKLTQLSSIGAVLKEDSLFRTWTIDSSAQFQRNNLSVQLSGQGSRAEMYGLSILSKDQHLDNHTVIRHRTPDCSSREIYKGIYAQESQGVFDGTIIVEPHAQKIDAVQYNHSLVLSEQARINSRPQLKIWADDVKCTHGATVGQIDNDALYYLQSRGIGHEEARAILIQAFCSELFTDKFNEPLSLKLDELLRGCLARSL